MKVGSPRGCPVCPCIEGVYKEEGSPDQRVMSLREFLANLACKLCHFVEHIWAWLLSGSYGFVAAWCDVVLLCWPWRHCRHGGDSLVILCDVVLVVVFIIAS
jgi:hypothetical protein